MSKYAERIQQILGYAESKKVTERKKCITELLDLYNNEDAVREISNNSEKKIPGKQNWSCILYIVHKVLLSKADKISNKDAFCRMVERVVWMTVQNANSGIVPLLKCSDLMPLILQILEANVYLPFHETYIDILKTFVLPIRTYQINMSSEQWKELLKICTALYENCSLYTRKRIILDTLQMIVDYGCWYSDLLLSVKKMLPFLETMFHDVKSHEDMIAESAYKLANSICFHIATECRLALCKFSENILADIISLNGSPEKYKLLLLFVKIHHPQGAGTIDDGGCASNWGDWSEVMKNIYIMVLKDCKPDILPESFVHLGSEVFRYILEKSDNSMQISPLDTSNYLQPTKRRRVSTKFDNLLDMISDRKPEDAWPFIQIFTVLLKNYPICLKPDDLSAFLRSIVDLLTQSCKNEAIMDDLYKLSTVLVKVGMPDSSVQSESCNIHWDKIWDILLRSLNMNQNEISGHKLAQYFIIHNKLKDSNTLLKSYLTNTIRWSPMSVRTLRILSEHMLLPTDMSTFNINSFSQMDNPNSLRMHILKWALNIPWQRMALQMHVEDFCSLIISIILKSKYQYNKKTEKHIGNSTCYCELGGMTFSDLTASYPIDIEECYFLLTYKRNLFENKSLGVKPDTKTDNDILYIQELVTYLIKTMSDIMEGTESVDLSMIIIKATVMAKTATILIQLRILSGDIESSSLVASLKKYLEIINRSLIELVPVKTKYIYLVNIMKTLNILYKTSYHADVARVVASYASLDMVEKIFGLMNTEDNETIDFQIADGYYNNYSPTQDRRRRTDKDNNEKRRCKICKNGVIRIFATNALVRFCCMGMDTTKHESQIIVMKNLLSIDVSDVIGTIDFKLALIILRSLNKYGKDDLWTNYKEKPIEAFLELYQHSHKDQNAIVHILKIFPFFFEYATKYNADQKRLVNVMSQIYDQLKRNSGSILANVEYVKCLSYMVQIDPIFSSSTENMQISAAVSIVNNISSFLKSSIFVIRLEAIRAITQIYSENNIEFTWKEKLFDKIEETLNSLFILDEQPPEDIKSDEIETRQATVTLLLLTIICTNGALQSRALQATIRLSIARHMEIETLQKAFNSVSDRVNYKTVLEDNLKSLLLYWINTQNNLDLFPWKVLQCKSEGEFYMTYIHVLVVIHLQNFDMDATGLLCNRTGFTFTQVFEEVLPQILPWIMYCMHRPADAALLRPARNMLQAILTNASPFEQIRKLPDLLNDKFEGTLLYIIQRLHDEDYMNKTFEIRSAFPKSDPPHFKKETVDECLQSLEDLCRRQGLSHGESLLQILTSKAKASVLQKVLLSLGIRIYKLNFSEHKLKAFHQYTYFCTHIVTALKEDYCNGISAYVVREIGYNLLHLIKLNDSTLSGLACKYLLTFLQCILPKRKAEVEEILNFSVMTLISVAQTDRISTALDILQYLIIDQKNILCDAIEKLNTFPNIPEFQHIRSVHNALKSKTGEMRSLQDEVQHFLATVLDKNANNSAEDISHLRVQLSTRKNEMRRMYEDLGKLRGFAEDCAASPLHQLIYRLVKLTESEDHRVAMEAAKCLGELGPSDLTTMILHFGQTHIKETTNLVEILTYRIVTRLTEFIIQSNIELRKSSADALYIVLASPWGCQLLDETFVKYMKNILNAPTATVRMDYIYPFLSNHKSKPVQVGTCRSRIVKLFDRSNPIWSSKSDGPYQDWIIEVTCTVVLCFTGLYSENLVPVCELSPNFCELILPRMLILFLQIDNDLIEDFSTCISEFFEYHFNCNEELNDVPHNSLRLPSCSHQIVHCMLNIVNYIRIQGVDELPLKLNYMHIARAAQYCSAYFTTILYAEMYCENALSENEQTSIFGSIPKIDIIYEHKPGEGRLIQKILRDTYLKISDPDAIYGSGSSHFQDRSTRTQYYAQLGKWDGVMIEQDVELSYGNTSSIRDFGIGLHQSGLECMLSHCISAYAKIGEKIDDDIQYECAWRLGDWNLCNSNHNFETETIERSYHYHHYQALKYFHENNESALGKALDNARTSVISSLRTISLESSKSVYEKLMQLQMIREIEELSFTKPESYKEVLQKWEKDGTGMCNEFRYIEPILTQRAVMYQIKNTLYEHPIIKQALPNTYLEISKLAANQGHLHVAARTLAVLAKQPDLRSNVQDRLAYQEALLAWLQKDFQFGRHVLRALIQKTSAEPSLTAQVLRVYGDCMAETKSENPQTVIENYYLRSIETCSSISTKDENVIKNLYDTQVALARFADAQFQQISSYMASPQFASVMQSVEHWTKGKDTAITTKDQDVRKAEIINQRQNSYDAAKLKHMEKEKDNYLTLALRYYIRTLQQSEDHNLLIFRVVALWLDNKQHEEVNEILKTELDKISSFKFIPLVPQLAAHMSNNNDEFSKKIYRVMERCALKHPHHTLPVLLALKNLYGDYEYSSTNKSSRPKEEARVLGAKQLLARLQRSEIGPILREMDKLSHSLVMLANLEAPQSKGNSVIKIPKSQEILKIKNFDNIIVPTLTVPVNSSGNYNVIGVYKYADIYETVGGVNAPKKVTCIGFDGISRHELVKGKDDLRQDAVMQQVFGVMNTLLRACKETQRRKLTIRTYKIVPLTQRAGVLEWCNNTLPVISVLVGSGSQSGLQKKYYPNDYTANTCREKMHNASKSSNEKKLSVFMDCCFHLHPALHYFFTEKYPSPEIWFERRLAYTRSVATTSMAGYILGLGDRHLSNMLIDQTTAEIIHIDFGIAFEQGKLLPVPETIPFRLTRNIEVAMGISGVEGTMRRCCEETLTVMRQQRQIIITLLQVLLYDPLFTWSITPSKAYHIQSGGLAASEEQRQGVTETNKSAARALLRIEQKLQGTEEGVASSVPGQVERLIQQARDPFNLCRLFCGWQPYL